MRRTEDYINRVAADASARPYEVYLRLKDSTMDWYFGRFADPNKAHAVGLSCLRSTRPSDLPFGRKCLNYWVIDSLSGQRVERQTTLAAD
jgi:hypothetical protein